MRFHSAVGNTMIGAKVNNRIASYDQVLRNGDIVEVLTSKSAKGPSRDWLNICRSNQARIKIKQWFKREKRDENIIRGKASFESELRRIGINPEIIQSEDVLPLVLKRVSFDCWMICTPPSVLAASPPSRLSAESGTN